MKPVVFRAIAHGDLWAVWRYLKSGEHDSGSPDRIIAYCDRWDDALEIAESMNVGEWKFSDLEETA